MVIAFSWIIAVGLSLIYVHFGTRDLNILDDGFKAEIYRAAIALLILRVVFYTAKEIFLGGGW